MIKKDYISVSSIEKHYPHKSSEKQSLNAFAQQKLNPKEYRSLGARLPCIT